MFPMYFPSIKNEHPDEHLEMKASNSYHFFKQKGLNSIAYCIKPVHLTWPKCAEMIQHTNSKFTLYHSNLCFCLKQLLYK